MEGTVHRAPHHPLLLLPHRRQIPTHLPRHLPAEVVTMTARGEARGTAAGRQAHLHNHLRHHFLLLLPHHHPIPMRPPHHPPADVTMMTGILAEVVGAGGEATETARCFPPLSTDLQLIFFPFEVCARFPAVGCCFSNICCLLMLSLNLCSSR